MKRLQHAIIPLLAAAAILTAPAIGAMPKVSVVSGRPGGPAIVVDGQPRAPIFFFGNNQFGRDGVLLEQLRLAAGTGIPFFKFHLPLAWHGSAEEAAATVDTFCAAHPEGYFYIGVWLGPNRDWLDAHPDARITYAGGSAIDMASPSSHEWREEARRQLVDLVRQTMDGPHGERFIGVALHYLNTAEWFYPECERFPDYSPAHRAAFRDWLRARYGKAARLREAWGRPDADFDTAEPPSPRERDASAWGPFRDPVRHRPAMDFQRFQSECMADTIAYFARAVKETTGGRALAGAYYGYTLELNHNGPAALANSGHLALGRLLECPDIDLIHAPYSYFERGLGEPGHFHLPVDSIALHGKLAVLEEDSFTHLAREPAPETGVPGWEQRTQSLEETLSLVRRNYGNFLAHRCGFWIFDLLSDGRWNERQFWDSAGLLRRIAATLRSEPPFEPEVAFCVSEDAVHYLRASTHPWLLESLGMWRRELGLLGAPVGYYLQSDLPRLPRSVRLIILANALVIQPEEQRAIQALLARGGTVVYTGAAGLYTDGPGPSVASVGRTTGFGVSGRFDVRSTTISYVNEHKPPVFDLKEWYPRLIISTLSAGETALARLIPGDEVTAAIRPEGTGWVVHTAYPRLPAGLLRDLCVQAGVHLYTAAPGAMARVGPYLFVHTGPDQAKVALHWPHPPGAVQRLVPHSRYPVPFSANRWDDALPPAGTGIYLVAPSPAK